MGWLRQGIERLALRDAIARGRAAGKTVAALEKLLDEDRVVQALRAVGAPGW